jgi:phosphoserine phosphatase RsbU/P
VDQADLTLPLLATGDFPLRLAALVDEHAIVAVTDAAGVILEVNRRFCEISGYGREELVGKTHRIVRSGEHPPAFFKEMWDTIGSGRVWHGTICNRAKSGRHYWVETTILPLREDDGRIGRYLALRTDVTRLKETERGYAQALAASEQAQGRIRIQDEQRKLFFDHAPIGLSWVEWGRSGMPDVYHLNQRFCQLIGLTQEEARDFANIRRATHPDDRDRQQEAMAAVLRGERDSFSMEKRYVHRDGSVVWGNLTVAILRAPDGRISHQFAMLEDITERRRSQEKLGEALARLEEMERIVNRSPSVVVLWRAEPGWPVEYVSQSIRQFGYQADDFVARRLMFGDITHPEDLERVSAELEAHAAAGHLEYNQEYRIVCADGSVRWVEDHTVVRVNARGEVTHHEGLLNDVTARKEAGLREKEARERDLHTAAEVQARLAPRVFPAMDEVEIAALSVPSMHIGGDYHDVLPVDARRWGFVIADVAGKGAGAALMMAACRAALRIFAAGEPSPGVVVRRLNQALHGDMPQGMFIALTYGVLDLDTHRFRYVRAGHEPGLLIRRGGGEAELMGGAGLALGLDAGPLFDEVLEEREVALGQGDLMAFYTDGITEAAKPDGEEFGRDRLASSVARHDERPLAEIVRTVDRYLRQFSALAPKHDDRTLLLVRPRQ